MILYTEDNEIPAEGMVRIPSLVGLGLTQARVKVREAELSLSAQGNGFCVSQDPAAGSMVPKGTMIRAVFRMDVGQ